jgi:type II secretory pathway pseudopilin PulG
MTPCRIDSLSDSNNVCKAAGQNRGEEGYALVALLALMSVLALMMISVAPSIRQQAQREREVEAISRGEEIAEAIRLYILEKRTLPTSMEQLLEGLPRGTKKLQILRANAAIDPLTESGEWKLMRPKGSEMIEFQKQVMLYNNGTMPKTRDAERIPNVYTQVLVQMNNLGDIKSAEDAPGDEDDSENPTGPFIGVASRSRRNSVINYYGIDRHDKWVFTPLFRQ